MKHMKRKNVYQCSNYNCVFDPKTNTATSYSWWVFVSQIEGKVVFNNYRYSNSTSKHQSKVRRLLDSLNIKIDVELPVPQGLPGSYRRTLGGMESAPVLDSAATLEEVFLASEEYLFEQVLENELKRQERNQKAAFRRKMKRLEQYLENDCAFRDYTIEPETLFGKVNSVAVHQKVSMKTLEGDVENALYNFDRDGFGSIVFYV